jgi:hypothetical protein
MYGPAPSGNISSATTVGFIIRLAGTDAIFHKTNDLLFVKYLNFAH